MPLVHKYFRPVEPDNPEAERRYYDRPILQTDSHWVDDHHDHRHDHCGLNDDGRGVAPPLPFLESEFL